MKMKVSEQRFISQAHIYFIFFMKSCKTFILEIFILSTISHYTQAQNDSYQTKLDYTNNRRPKAIYVELLGSSGFGTSINYDMRFKSSHKGWGFRAGIATPTTIGTSTIYRFPILINRVSSSRRVAFEVAAGFTVAYRRSSYEDFNNIIHYNHNMVYPAVANVGVRFQPMKTGVVWRLYWAPTWEVFSPQQNFTGWVGTSLGIGFN